MVSTNWWELVDFDDDETTSVVESDNDVNDNVVESVNVVNDNVACDNEASDNETSDDESSDDEIVPDVQTTNIRNDSRDTSIIENNVASTAAPIHISRPTIPPTHHSDNNSEETIFILETKQTNALRQFMRQMKYFQDFITGVVNCNGIRLVTNSESVHVDANLYCSEWAERYMFNPKCIDTHNQQRDIRFSVSVEAIISSHQSISAKDYITKWKMSRASDGRHYLTTTYNYIPQPPKGRSASIHHLDKLSVVPGRQCHSRIPLGEPTTIKNMIALCSYTIQFQVNAHAFHSLIKYIDSFKLQFFTLTCESNRLVASCVAHSGSHASEIGVEWISRPECMDSVSYELPHAIVYHIAKSYSHSNTVDISMSDVEITTSHGRKTRPPPLFKYSIGAGFGDVKYLVAQRQPYDDRYE